MPVRLPFQHGQAIVVRPQARGEESVTIEEQVLWRDRRRECPTAGVLRDELRRLRCGDVLHDNLEARDAGD